jgi:hypothetical protein
VTVDCLTWITFLALKGIEVLVEPMNLVAYLLASSILSGPAGGVVGYALTSWDPKEKAPIIGYG